MNSGQWVQFEANDTVFEFKHEEEENEQAIPASPESLAREGYAMSGRRHKSDFGSPKHSIAFPMIPKDLSEAFPDEVKVSI